MKPSMRSYPLLLHKSQIMFHHDRECILEPEPDEWGNHLYEPQMLQGANDTYYYAFAPNMFDIDLTRVLPFEKYKENQIFKIEA